MDRRSLHAIPDAELLARLAALLRESRATESELVAHIGEVDERKLYAHEGSPSMYAYCIEVLRLSEAEAYLRIAAARASREHPLLLEMLADGRLHLSGVGKLAPYLTRDNAAELLARAAHKTKRQIEELIALVAPRPDVPTVVRKLPQRRPAAASDPAPPLCSDRSSLTSPPAPPAAPPALDSQTPVDPPAAGREGPVAAEAAGHQLRPDAVAASEPSPTPGVLLSEAFLPQASLPDVSLSDGSLPDISLLKSVPAGRLPTPTTTPVVVEPLAAGRYKVQFTASTALKHKLERLQSLMRSQVPAGDLAAVIDAAVTEKLERLEARRFARTKAPRKTLSNTSIAPLTRHVPAAVRRAVHERDGDRCRYLDAQGRRCSERGRLEFHHRHPFGHGGDHSPRNLALLCRAHNTLMAEGDYGRRAMAHARGWVSKSPPRMGTDP